MNRNCSLCDIMIDENIYLKHRTICKKCHNGNRRKNNNNTITENEIVTTPQQPKINNNNVSTHENHAYVVIGLRNVGKTYYMLKIPKKIGNRRPIHEITRWPNQYQNYNLSTEIKPINRYGGSIVIFDDMLGARNCSQGDEIFTRGKHEDLDVYYISQSYFALPRQSIRNNSVRLKFSKQTLRDVQGMYYDIGAYDIKYDDFKEMCHKAWSEIFNYLYFDKAKIKMKVNIVFSTKAKTHT